MEDAVKPRTVEQERRSRFVRTNNDAGRRFRVPIGPVADHIDVLCLSLTQTEIARLAQEGMRRRIRTGMGPVHQTTISQIRLRKHPTVQCEIAAAILAIRPPTEPLPDTHRMPSAGAQRRIAALMHQGFGLQSQAEHLGFTKHVLWGLMRRDSTTGRTHQAVACMYDKLHQADPADYGIVPLVSCRAKSFAVRNGYAPAMCWDPDTIDNPDAFPEHTGNCGTENGWNIHLRECIVPCQPCRTAHSAYNKTHKRSHHKQIREAYQ